MHDNRKVFHYWRDQKIFVFLVRLSDFWYCYGGLMITFTHIEGNVACTIIVNEILGIVKNHLWISAKQDLLRICQATLTCISSCPLKPTFYVPRKYVHRHYHSIHYISIHYFHYLYFCVKPLPRLLCRHLFLHSRSYKTHLSDPHHGPILLEHIG